MGLHVAQLPDLAIPNGTKPSNALTRADIEDAIGILLIAPAALDAVTYTIQIRRNGAATWVALQEGDIGVALADVLPPAAGKAQFYDFSRLGISAGHSFRINAASNVGDALHIWEASKIWTGM
ncbi:hypothetical protein LCGC14_2618940 [marine sediment metagenome]|uniref:Uncharacterized protein n=1 Tax=marine sediment metagenome TaxID=412755 RepID=A0A0F9A3K9_9ZZZZ